MENTAQKIDPPDRGNFANIVKEGGLKPSIRKNHCDLPDVKSRWFRCRIRNDKFEESIIRQFKHIKVCAYQHTRFNKRQYLVLNVGFDISSLEGQSEYDKAREITLQSGSVIKAVPDDQLVDGKYKPRPPQKIYLDCVPYELFQDRDQLASALKEYVDFYEEDMWEWICEKGCYTGKVSVEVKLIKEKPPRDLEISFNGLTVKLWTLTRGLDSKIKLESSTDANEAIVCHSCKKTGHQAKNCETRKNRIFSWKCPICKGQSAYTYCKQGSCMVKSTMDVVDEAMDAIGIAGSSLLEGYTGRPLDDLQGAVLRMKSTQNKITRKLNAIKKVKLAKSKDEAHKVNKIKSLEVRVIRYALDSAMSSRKCHGLLNFAEIFDKRWLECAKVRGYEKAKPWFDEEKKRFIEQNTITEADMD